MAEAIAAALRGDSQVLKTVINDGTMAGSAVMLDVVPRLDDTGMAVGVVVTQSAPCAITVDDTGRISEVNEEMARLMGLDSSDIIGNDFMDIVETVSQEAVFGAVMDCFDARRPRGCTGNVVTQNEDGSLGMTHCTMDMSVRDLGEGQEGVMVVIQPENLRQLKKVKGKVQSVQARGDVKLKQVGDWEACKFHKFEVESVAMKHQHLGGALASSAVEDLPEEPEWRMLYEIKAGANAEEFTLPQLRAWMLKTPAENRPECLQKINPWQQKKIKHVWEQMDTNENGVVDEDEFLTWWLDYVETGPDPIIEVENEVTVTQQKEDGSRNKTQHFTYGAETTNEDRQYVAEQLHSKSVST